MSLPQPDPSLPGGSAPLFSDTDAARGDHLRANNQAIWENLEYLNNGENINDADEATPVDADKVGFFQIVGGIIKYVTWANVKTILQTAFAEMFVAVGTVITSARTTAPSGYLACNGAAVSRSTYAALFAAIGTTYGVGDGSTTFNLPDLRGLFVRGAGAHGTMTKAAGGAFDGGAVGATSNDQFQGHTFNYYRWNAAGTFDDTVSEGNDPVGITDDFGAPVSDGANGTPRTGDETKPASISLLYCIKT